MILLQLLKPLGSDFVVYYEAAKMFLLHLNPYQGLFTRTFPYNYPPPSLLFLWPLALLDFKIANILWNILSLLSVIISIGLLYKLAANKIIAKFSHRIIGLLVLIGLFTLPFFPVKFNIGNGQINHFIFLFFVLSIYFYSRGHKNLSAMFLAFATGIKIAPIIFVLYWVIKKDWKQIVRLAISLIFLVLLTLVFQPWQYQWDYVFKVLPLSFTLGAKDWYYNQSLEGFLARSFHLPQVILGLTYLGSILILSLTWLRGRKLNNLRLIAAVSSLYLIVHPIALQHYFAFSIIPLILLGADSWPIKKNKISWVVLVICYFLLAFDIKGFDKVPTNIRLVLSHDFYGIFLLWLLALWKENIIRILAILWISVITVSYILMLVCRAKICF